jgi:hypothetical protein
LGYFSACANEFFGSARISAGREQQVEQEKVWFFYLSDSTRLIKLFTRRSLIRAPLLAAPNVLGLTRRSVSARVGRDSLQRFRVATDDSVPHHRRYLT